MTIATVGSRFVSPMWSSFKNIAHDYGNFVIGVEQQSKMTDVLRPLIKEQGFHNFGSNLKTAWIASKDVVKDKSVWGVIKESFKSIPEELKGISKMPWLSKVEKVAGKQTKILEMGKFKTVFKTLGKRLPLIGNLACFAFAVPSIYSAFTDKNHGGGIGAGIKEIGKTVVDMAGFTLGAVIGSAICPGAGSIIGGLVGGWLTSKLTGDSFSEKVAAEDEKTAQSQAQAQTQQVQQGTQQQNNPYAQLALNPSLAMPGYATNPMDQDLMSSYYTLRPQQLNQVA